MVTLLEINLCGQEPKNAIIKEKRGLNLVLYKNGKTVLGYLHAMKEEGEFITNSLDNPGSMRSHSPSPLSII
jgi:hypothetical protein